MRTHLIYIEGIDIYIIIEHLLSANNNNNLDFNSIVLHNYMHHNLAPPIHYLKITKETDIKKSNQLH